MAEIDIKINELNLAGSVVDNMQFETDQGGTSANKVTALQIKDYVGGGGEAFVALEDMNEPTGFPNSDDALVTIDDLTRTVTLTPAGSDYFFYSRANKFTKSAPASIIISDVEGYHAIYYNSLGELAEAVNPSLQVSENIIRLECYVANIYWDAVNKESIYWTKQNELHGLQMDGSTHSNKHFTQGTQYLDGAALNTLLVDDPTPTDANAQFGINIGYGLDEDRAFTAAAVLAITGLPIYYLEGAVANARRSYNPGFSILTGGSGLAMFNEEVLGVYQNTEATSGNYVWVHVFLSNNYPEPYVAAMGSAQYSSLGVARDAFSDDLEAVNARKFGIIEYKAIGSVLYETKSSYSNSVKSRIVSTNNGDYEDTRFQKITSTLSPSSHDSLGGLTSSFSHTQYVKADKATSGTSNLYELLRYNDTVGIAKGSGVYISDDITAIDKTILPVSSAVSIGIACSDTQDLYIGAPNDFTRQPNYIGIFGSKLDIGHLNISTFQVMETEIHGHLTISSLTDGSEDISMKFNNAIVKDDGIVDGIAPETQVNIGDVNSHTSNRAAGIFAGRSNFASGLDSVSIGGNQGGVAGSGSAKIGGSQCYVYGDGSATIGALVTRVDSDYSLGLGTYGHLGAAAERSAVWSAYPGPLQAPELTSPNTFHLTPYGYGTVAIGTATPHASAILDVASTTRGVLPPRMTTIQRIAISSPAAGLMVYDIDTDAYFYFDGSVWVQLGGAQDSIKAGMYKNSSQSVSSDSNTIITNWTGTDFSSGVTVNTSTGVMTIQRAGLYYCSSTLFYEGSEDWGVRRARFFKNAETIEYGKDGIWTDEPITCTPGCYMQLIIGDTVKLVAWQESGASLAISGTESEERCEFQICRITD